MKRWVHAATEEVARDEDIINSAQQWDDMQKAYMNTPYNERGYLNPIFTDRGVASILNAIIDGQDQYRYSGFGETLAQRMDEFFYYLKTSTRPNTVRKIKEQFKQRCPFYYYNLDTSYLPEAKKRFAQIDLRVRGMLAENFPGTNLKTEYGRAYMKLYYTGKNQAAIDAIISCLENDADVFEVDYYPTASYYRFNVYINW